MNSEIEIQTFVDIAKSCLEADQLPEPIRIALYTILTKKTSASKSYHHIVINENVRGVPKNKSPLNKGKRDSIRNILILWYLFGADTNKTKSFLSAYAERRSLSSSIKELEKLANKQYLEFFCLGVVRENVESIIDKLTSSEFNLFEQKLPSPFFTTKKTPYDISPMRKLFSQEIPWQDYMERYKQADALFNEKKYSDAKQILIKLEQDTIVRLPVIESLNKNIKAQEDEALEAWEYFNKILN
ncbi:hypothetical protein Q4561_18205 [Alteromonas sp. 1_MG-2023]|uniref:hypothetical protein n=1 Tax=Alteromonas sp. 1_MG-2023 TaxID=3062669 RepID=UPI0026E27F09|nr:hypothetical protein [Alteromonas sp. 1_MG-2023]MDO6569011.1 hypothetical protein [Alteromonas sp. 1_MG-2023]